ncbi:S-receptor-like serine/threonine-protein kinase [Trema orientale]|uniref:Receptor-like serine/threonine-protein kinase n=1 Tax=Trema orientale TaxID=63057 RepID=A0A2P5F2U6_TREOI|nr:S-receptor-like serine/threonine-protein kinase [Trema orientale]
MSAPPRLPNPTIAFLLLSFTLLVMTSNANIIRGFEAHETQFQRPRRRSCSISSSSSSLYSLDGSKFRHRLQETTNQIEELVSTRVVIEANTTISSKNETFQLGFFNPNGNWYLGIWYSSISPQTCVWVANRERPVKNITSSSLEITETGRLAVRDSDNSIVWQSTNLEIVTDLKLLENGNLVLLTAEDTVSWQSFDYPTDTWLPGMNLTTSKGLTSWRTLSDPSPGLYSLRLRPDYSEFELIFNGSKPYWSTGNWTGKAFANVPEMMVPYIYKFHFDDPFKPTASFGFTEAALDSGLSPPLTRFQIHHSGQLMQYTWSPQTENWNTFWLEPDSTCRVFGSCGKFGLCNSLAEKPCKCLTGFEPVNQLSWDNGDYSDGCRRRANDVVSCEKSDDGFEQIGAMSLEEGTKVESFNSSFDLCQKTCLENCTCIGVDYNEKTNLCKNLFGSLLNLRNLSSDSIDSEVVYVRVGTGGILKNMKKKNKHLNTVVLVAIIVGSIAVLGFVIVAVIFFVRRKRRKAVEEDGVFPVSTLKVFSYKELHQITRGFSEKIGHGGFGTVFQGKLSDSTTLVAVKRLERPGSGEKEFRAEVCTIGNIQHVNLVRLRGFCSEDSHRLLVYDYMPNGSLSVYLRKEGPNLSWDLRFRVAIGTARGIAYLHEECRDCIIHCDIKPENILLDSDYTPKVSDFGLAKLLGRDFSRVLATMRGTWGYVAPEWISGVAITTKADVYSYGMTLIELIGGRRNVEAPLSPGGREGGGATAEKWFFPPWATRQIIEGNVAAVVDQRLGGAYNVEEARRVALVAVWCIQDDEAIRPTMGTVVKMLEGVVEVTVPPSPKLLQALVSGESFHGVKVDSGGGGGLPTGSSFSPENLRLSTAGSESSLGNASSSPVNENVN